MAAFQLHPISNKTAKGCKRYIAKTLLLGKATGTPPALCFAKLVPIIRENQYFILLPARRCELGQVLPDVARGDLFRICEALALDPFQEFARREPIKDHGNRRAIHGLPRQEKVGIRVTQSGGGK